MPLYLNRWSILVYLILIIVLGCNFSRKSSPLSTMASIKFRHDTLNFGSIKKGDSVIVNFHFTNTGDARLHIMNVVPGCTCSVVAFPHREFLNGESDDIQVKYSSLNTNDIGHISKTVIVRSNTKPNITILTILGIVH